MNVIVDCGAVPVLVKHLQSPPASDGDDAPSPYDHEVEKGSAFALGLLAVKVIQFMPFCYSFLSFSIYFFSFGD